MLCYVGKETTLQAYNWEQRHLEAIGHSNTMFFIVGKQTSRTFKYGLLWYYVIWIVLSDLYIQSFIYIINLKKYDIEYENYTVGNSINQKRTLKPTIFA